MATLKAPCFENSKDCENRKVGCRSACEKWIKYEKEYEMYLAEKTKKAAVNQYESYHKGRIIENKKKYSPNKYGK